MVKIPISQAKRLGYSIKGYVFIKDKATPQPVIEKTKKRKKRIKKEKKETIPFIKEKNVYRLNLGGVNEEEN